MADSAVPVNLPAAQLPLAGERRRRRRRRRVREG